MALPRMGRRLNRDAMMYGWLLIGTSVGFRAPALQNTVYTLRDSDDRSEGNAGIGCSAATRWGFGHLAGDFATHDHKSPATVVFFFSEAPPGGLAIWLDYSYSSSIEERILQI